MTIKIVLTGGPCAGKTTALARVAERLESLGFRVFQVPESATIVFGGGAVDRTSYAVQKSIADLAILLEDMWVSLAEDERSVILCDRGVIDIQAYCSPEVWRAIAEENGGKGALFSRYDAVIHMVTAADGAEEHYSLSTNATRCETPEQARIADGALIMAWTGHPHLRVIPNRGTFADKIRHVVQEVCTALGVPEPVEREHKFVVRCDLNTIPVPHATSRIRQDYLQVPGARVRARSTDGHTVFTHTIKIPKGDGRVERERKISKGEYESQLLNKDPKKATIIKDRTCFVWQGQYFEIDTFADHSFQLMELEVHDLADPIQVPPFMEIVQTVTGDDLYSNSSLASVLMETLQSYLMDRVMDPEGVSVLSKDVERWFAEKRPEVVDDLLRALPPGVLGRPLAETLLDLTEAHAHELPSRASFEDASKKRWG